MDMDMLASTMSRLPYFQPGMMINSSETCATRKITQCMDWGIDMNDISNKFAGNSAPQDLTPAEFRARKAVVQQVQGWCKAHANAKEKVVNGNEWAPILYNYEIVKTSAKTERDWGHLLFTDMTLSRFMLVMTFPEACNCGNLSHHDYGALTRYHANRLMCLLIYLNEEWGCAKKPVWIRATYVTPKERHRLNYNFLDTVTLAPGENRQAGRPPIFVITPENFDRTLLPSEFEKIDNTVARSFTSKTRKGTDARNKLCGTKEERPDVSSALRSKNVGQCASCTIVKDVKELKLCSRCKLTRYCSQACQSAAWKYHKASCRKASESNQVAAGSSTIAVPSAPAGVFMTAEPSIIAATGSDERFGRLGINGTASLVVIVIMLLMYFLV